MNTQPFDEHILDSLALGIRRYIDTVAIEFIQRCRLLFRNDYRSYLVARRWAHQRLVVYPTTILKTTE